MKKIISKRIIQLLFLGLYLASVIVIYSQMRITHFLPTFILNYISYLFPLLMGVVLMFVKNKKAREITSLIMLVVCIMILLMRIVVLYATEGAMGFSFFGSKLSLKNYGLYNLISSWASMNSIGTPTIVRSTVHFLFKPEVVNLVFMNYILPCISTVLMCVVFIFLYEGTESSAEAIAMSIHRDMKRALPVKVPAW